MAGSDSRHNKKYGIMTNSPEDIKHTLLFKYSKNKSRIKSKNDMLLLEVHSIY